MDSVRARWLSYYAVLISNSPHGAKEALRYAGIICFVPFVPFVPQKLGLIRPPEHENPTQPRNLPPCFCPRTRISLLLRSRNWSSCARLAAKPCMLPLRWLHGNGTVLVCFPWWIYIHQRWTPSRAVNPGSPGWGKLVILIEWEVRVGWYDFIRGSEFALGCGVYTCFLVHCTKGYSLRKVVSFSTYGIGPHTMDKFYEDLGKALELPSLNFK